MSEPTAPEGGVSNLQTAPAPASPGVSLEVPASNAGGTQPDNLFNAGYSKGAEKHSARADEAETKLKEAEAKLLEVANSGLNPEELRGATEQAQAATKAVEEKLNQQVRVTAEYFKTRVDALPEDLKVIMDTQDPGNFEGYTKMLDHCERLNAKGAEPTTTPIQGGAVPQGQPQSKVFQEYQAARASGDNIKLRAMMTDPTKSQEIRDGLKAQSKQE